MPDIRASQAVVISATTNPGVPVDMSQGVLIIVTQIVKPIPRPQYIGLPCATNCLQFFDQRKGNF